MRPEDLREFSAFFDPLIRDYHANTPADTAAREHNWDLSRLGLTPVSIRMRVARSVAGFNLPGRMTLQEREAFGRTMSRALQALIDEPEYGGRILQPTPALTDAHLMTDISTDPYMRSAGISNDWPHGRACYVSARQDAIVWIGEEDHLRIIVMNTGTSLGDTLARLRQFVGRIEALPGMTFVRDDAYGYVNSCPSNLGTGMRASVRLETPKVEVSPTRRFFFSEDQVLDKLFDNVRRLVSTQALALLLMLVVLSSNAFAQTDCTGNCVTIRSTGGFLGYLDGFPEFPAWPGDSFEGNPDLIPNPTPPLDPKRPLPYGGVIGVATFLQSHPVSTPSVLLISGNNQPQQIAALHGSEFRNSASRATARAATHWFWKRLLDLHPDAVGVGTEDVHRWLTQMRPENLTTWITDGISAGLPFVASNAIIRMTDEHLNTVDNAEHHLELDVAEDESLDFIEEVRITHTCSVRDHVRSAAFAFDAGPAVSVLQPSADESRAERESAATKARRAVLGNVCHTTLHFSERLRPGMTYRLGSSMTGASFRFTLTTHRVLTPHAAFGGVPVVGAAKGNVAIAIMGFVSPSAARRVPPEYFEWSKADGCAAAHCRIDIIKPEEAARAWLALLSPQGKTAPVLLAMSNLPEAETTAFLDAVPEVRLIAVSPDSGRLGRAAAALGASGVRYSGDRSFGAVVDRQQPDLAKLIVRPAWIGEYIHTATASFTATGPGNPWRVADAALAFDPVPGASLAWTTSARGTSYSAFLDPKRFRNPGEPFPAEPSAFRPYCAIDQNGPFDAISRERQGDLWTKPASFAGLVLDEMRRSARGDIAIVPQSWIDPDVIATIETPPETGVAPLSGFMLQRILYRSQGVVRVTIEGSQLADTIATLVASSAAAKDPVCVSGAGVVNSCPLSAIDTDDFLVDVRKPEDGNYYRVILPATLAREAGMTFNESAARDLLADLDARLSACESTAGRSLLPSDDPFAERLENQLARRPQHYLKIDPLTIDLSSTSVHEPDGSEGMFSRLPIEGFGEQPSRRVVIDGDVDAVLWDTASYAVRVPAQLRYDRTTVDQETSYDRDEFSVGFRIDRKRLPARWARVYAGVFFDGRLFDRRDTVDGFAGPITFTIRPQRNFGLGYGLEVPKARFGRITVNGLQLTHFMGHVYNVPIGVRAGSQTYDTATHVQSRVQVDAETETALPLAATTLSTEHRYRWYHHDSDAVGLFTERSFYTKLALDIAIKKRCTVGPYIERHDVDAAMTGNGDQHFSATSWGLQVKVPVFWNGRSIE